MIKVDVLKTIISQYKSAIIAFSGGVDSTFLARISKDVLGGNLLLVTATSSTYPPFELEQSRKLAYQLGIEQQIIASEELDIPGFAQNPADRCYYCKRELFSKILDIASQKGYETVFDGSNADDLKDYRPGRKALLELGIVSPLCEAGFTKEDIRTESRKLGLATADKPPFACLASRFPYGETITKEKLERVGKAETEIRETGFNFFRVRSHGNLAMLEFAESEIDRAWKERSILENICKKAGFVYVAIDTYGYRTGAMNEELRKT